jgi:hypothetical protein|tara:strand:- start:552 stop:899 length:348 start_codon:yes stop_codon:yes gene_type:complete
MLTSSAKAKGRRLQQWVRDLILDLFPTLEEDDVKSTSMGAGGEDIQLSPAARKLMPITVECKNKKSFAVYKDYEQSVSHSKKFEPVLVIKGDRKKPLAVVDATHYFRLLREVADD